MNNSIIQQIEEQLQCSITSQQTTGGGCIAQTSIIQTNDGRNYFLKQGFEGSMFQKEANGLIELRKAKAFAVPEVILVANNFLLLEAIETGNKENSFFNTFGVAFAHLHQYTNDQFGFFEDNYIGSTPQINKASTSWMEFYFNHRLLYQYQLAEQNGYADKHVRDGFHIIEKRLPAILDGSEEKPCLLHGDLWGGNYMVGPNGEPVLIDPAVYYGHREADLAMTKLFGGFSVEFYNSYFNTYPLKEGYQYRENIYLLYHVLNHLNLFGTSYRSQAIQLMNSYR